MMGSRRLAPTLIALLILGGVAYAQDEPYSPKNGVLNFKALFFGAGFRVTAAIPMQGDFSKFGRVEIVRPESLMGQGLSAEFMAKLGQGLVGEFQKGGRFGDVALVDSYSPSSAAALPSVPAPAEDFRQADPLDAPMRGLADLLVFDQQRREAAAGESASSRPGTLVVRCQVIDYAKGSRFLQMLMLDLGNALLTLRFSYYDKDTGEELGRTIVSSDNSSKVIPSAFAPRSAMTGVFEGLVDQVTRRKLAAER
jgi:hypothetical protein